MFALERPKEMAVIRPRQGRKRTDVDAAFKDMLQKLPKTFEYLGK